MSDDLTWTPRWTDISDEITWYMVPEDHDDGLRQLENMRIELCAFGYMCHSGHYPYHLDNYKMFKNATKMYNDLHDHVFNTD